MNKKGFTIVEILGSIVLIALLVVLTTPMIQKTLANSKEKINKIQEKQIKDAGKTVADEIVMCELTDDLKKMTNNKTCKELKDIIYGAGLNLSIQNLEDNNYIEKLQEKGGYSEKCINIKVDENTFEITVGILDECS